MSERNLDDWIEQMTNCASALKIATDFHTEDAKRIVTDPDIKLPEGCPSRASLAAMTLRRIEKNLSDVNHTFKELQEYIWKNYDYK